MKKSLLLSILCICFSFSILAEVPQNEVVIGDEAKAIFEELEGQFEYSYGAHVMGLTVDTIVRHNNKIKCSKETTNYSQGAPIVVYECISL